MKLIWAIIPLILFGVIGTQQSFAEKTLDFENCNGILSIDDVKNVIGDIDDITVDSRGVIPVDGEPGLETMCASTFESSGKTIGMTIVVMDSTDAAITLYEKNLDSFSTQDFEIREYLTFWNNFDVVLNDQGVGSFMVSQYDKFFISLRTGLEEKKTLADVEQLRVLSTIVQKKILDLDDVSISPPNPLPDNDVGPTTDEPPPKPGPAPIEDGEILSPKKQVSQGIEPEAVVCNEGLVLILRHNGSPVCVKEKTAEIFEERGWGSIPPPCCKPTMVSLATNFEECIAEGNPAMESYPRQCRTLDGKHFVESIPENKECEMIGGLWDNGCSIERRDLEDATSSYMNKIIPTLDDFRNTLNESKDIETIFFKFGEPHNDIGSGIHIYVYELNDFTQIWIGYTDRILYVQHVDVKGNILEKLF